MRAALKTWHPVRRCREVIDRYWGRILFGLLLIMLIGGYFALQPASNTAFAISATTDQMLVEPLCQDRMVWDLPAGHVLPVSAPPEAMSCTGAAVPVTVELRGGAQALLTSRADRRLDVRLSPGALAAECRLPEGRSALSVQVDGVDLPADAQGYFYRSGECDGSGAVDASGVLSVLGRLQIGAAIPEGAGWGGSSVAVSLLDKGEIVARLVAPFSNERMTLLQEKLDPGSIVDTLPCLGETAGGDAATRNECLLTAVSTPGFVRLLSDGLDVQAYPTRMVGVTPHLGEQRRINLTRWDILKSSSIAQVLAALFGVLLLLADVPEKLKRVKGLFELRATQKQEKKT